MFVAGQTSTGLELFQTVTRTFTYSAQTPSMYQAEIAVRHYVDGMQNAALVTMYIPRQPGDGQPFVYVAKLWNALPHVHVPRLNKIIILFCRTHL